MNEKEYLTIIAKLNKEEDAIHERREKAKQDYINSLPFKKGDKVVVIQKPFVLGKEVEEKKTICFIGDVEIKYGGWIAYNFRKMKKDGTMSNHTAGIYSFDRIEFFT